MTSVERDNTGLGQQSYGAFAQTEVDFRAEGGPLYFRLDLDLQMTSSDPDKTALGYPPFFTVTNGVKFGPPEWLMLQYSIGDSLKLRGGIVGHQIGLEEWDVWNTYFVTKSTVYNLTPGRMLGLEVGVPLGDYEVFAFGGCDLDFGGCIAADADGDGVNEVESGDGLIAGAGITTAQDFWSTWSGVAALPTLDYYVASITVEAYPHEDLSIAVDVVPGLQGVEDETGSVKQHFFFGGGVTVNVIPEAIVHPAFRFHGLLDPDDAAFGDIYPDLAASAGLSTSPWDGFKVALEAKVSKYTEDLVPSMHASISLARPEPSTYTARYEEEEPAAEGRRQRQRQVARPATGFGPRAF